MKLKLELNIPYGWYGPGDIEKYSLNLKGKEEGAIKNLFEHLGQDEVTKDQVETLIASGDNSLQELHRTLLEIGYEKLTEWLIKEGNELREESLLSAMEDDINNGLYQPTEDEEDYYDEDDDDEYDDDEDPESKQLEDYRWWMEDRDQEFQAVRYGLDIEAVWPQTFIDYKLSLTTSRKLLPLQLNPACRPKHQWTLDEVLEKANA